jgi:glycosyltransferase involved in cell wall biosynthesis
MAPKSSAPRILQVVHGFPPEGRGGTESYVLEASLALRASGADVSVLAGSMEAGPKPGLVATKVSGIPVTRLHRAGAFLDNWEKSYDPAAAALFDAHLADLRPDVVHVHHWIRLTRNLVEIAAARGIPAVVTLHDAAASCPRVFRVRDGTLCHRPLSVESCLTCVPRARAIGDDECASEIEAYRADFARELELASAILVPSRAHQDFVSRELGMPLERFQVVPHGRLERGRPSRESVPRLSTRIRIGFWGHLAPFKGYHLLLEALHELSDEERARFEVVCFGTAADPAYRARLDGLSRGLLVTEHGAFTPRDLSKGSFDVAVIPSIASESFSFVLDEAFELGVPAIVSDRGALAERLGDAGTTFEPESARSLASRLRRILEDPGILSLWVAAIPALSAMKEHAAALRSIYRGVEERPVQPVPVEPAIVTARLVRLASRLEDRTQALARASDVAADEKGQLERKDEVLAEFERSIGSYRDQLARKDEALHQFELSVADHKEALAGKDRILEERAARIAELEKSVKDAAAALEARDRTLAGFEKSVDAHQKRLGEREAVLAQFERSTSQMKAEIARLEREARSQLESRADAEIAWKNALAEHERSVALHAEALAERGREVEQHKARWAAVASELTASRAKVGAALLEARGLSAELAEVQAAAAVAREERERAERDAAALDRARADEQREIGSWRARAGRAEAALEATRAALESTEESLSASRKELEGARSFAARAEDDADRVSALAAKGAAALALADAAAGDRVARAEALVAAVIEQQARLEELRAWLRGAPNGSAGRAEVLRRLDALPRRLRVLMVVHDFLPYHAAGSEVYTCQLSKALSPRHEVELLFCENRPDRPQYEVRRGTYEGIPYREIVHHAAFPDFRSTYLDPRMEDLFEKVLDAFRPDVIHVQHTKFFGVGILEVAARRGIPIVYTLHEYMLLCARDGQMLQENLERCDQPEPGKCGACMGAKIVKSGPIARGTQRVGRGLARVMPGALKGIGTRIERRSAVRYAEPVDPKARQRFMEEREETIRKALARVDLFVAPSEFLRRTFIASGFVSPDRIVVSRYGQDLTRFSDAPKERSANLRVGYLGTIAAYKGVEVLVDALERLAAHAVEGRIHGVTEFFPDFVKSLEAKITNPRVKLMGRYENRDVGRILSKIDVLVVPSLWWENSPITIHEAFLAGVPVVASDQGGMAELVQDGKNGFLFKIGDAADLARVLLRFVADRGLLERLRPRRESIRDIREDALWTEDRYRRLIAAKANR